MFLPMGEPEWAFMIASGEPSSKWATQYVMIAKRRHRVRYSSKDERCAMPIMIRNKVVFLILKNFFFVTMSLLMWFSSQKTLTVVSFSGFLTTPRMNSAISDSI